MAAISLAERHDFKELPIWGLSVPLDQTKVPFQCLRIDKGFSTPVSISRLSYDDSSIDAEGIHRHSSVSARPAAIREHWTEMLLFYSLKI